MLLDVCLLLGSLSFSHTEKLHKITAQKTLEQKKESRSDTLNKFKKVASIEGVREELNSILCVYFMGLCWEGLIDFHDFNLNIN